MEFLTAGTAQMNTSVVSCSAGKKLFEK